jgi:hypothetical protein
LTGAKSGETPWWTTESLGAKRQYPVPDAARAVVADGDDAVRAAQIERQGDTVVEPVERVVVLGKGDPLGTVQHEHAWREGYQRD